MIEFEIRIYCGVRDKKLILYSQGVKRCALKEKEVHKRYVILGYVYGFITIDMRTRQ